MWNEPYCSVHLPIFPYLRILASTTSSQTLRPNISFQKLQQFWEFNDDGKGWHTNRSSVCAWLDGLIKRHSDQRDGWCQGMEGDKPTNSQLERIQTQHRLTLKSLNMWPLLQVNLIFNLECDFYYLGICSKEGAEILLEILGKNKKTHFPRNLESVA